MVAGDSSNPQDYEELGKLQRSESDKQRRKFLRKHRRTLTQRRKQRARKRGLIFNPPPGTTKLQNAHGWQFRGKVRYSYRGADDRYVIRIPRVFSLTKNPEETMDIFHTIAFLKQMGAHRIHFDHSKCEYMGLAASVVQDVMVLEMREEWRQRGVRYSLTGTMPTNREVNQQFRVMGMTKHLKISGVKTEAEEEAAFTQFELFRGKKSLGIKGSDQEKAPSDFTNYIDRCLREGAGYSLNENGKREIVRWAGEIITNAEEHSGTHEWYVIGFMKMLDRPGGDEKSQRIGECHMAIFNFGRSIAESLKSDQVPEQTRNELKEIADLHRRKFLFRTLDKYSEDDLFTLYALQEGVSSKNAAPGEGDRGNGTVKLITAFQTLGDSKDSSLSPVMTLISGSTRILFTKEYQMAPRGDRMIIAFNNANDLQQRPCAKHVHSLRGRFPGTILSFNFYIDREHLNVLTQK